MSRDPEAAHCPHCGMPLDEAGPRPVRDPLRFDLEKLAAVADAERAYDETVKVRVTQDDIRRLIEKRRKKRRK